MNKLYASITKEKGKYFLYLREKNTIMSEDEPKEFKFKVNAINMAKREAKKRGIELGEIAYMEK